MNTSTSAAYVWSAKFIDKQLYEMKFLLSQLQNEPKAIKQPWPSNSPDLYAVNYSVWGILH